MSRKWYPDILVDEYLPEGRGRAEAWLEPDADGRTAIYFDRNNGMTPVAIWSPGETVKLQWCEPRGEVTVRIMRDGTIGSTLRCPDTPDMFDVTIFPPPTNVITADANCFYDWSSETWAASIADFAQQYAEACAGEIGEDGDVVSVDVHCWSGPLSFIISADGKSLTSVPTEVSHHVHS